MGWGVEMRRGSCETSLAVVIFWCKFVVILKARIALDLYQYCYIGQTNHFLNFLLSLEQRKHYKELAIKMNCEVLFGAC